MTTTKTAEGGKTITEDKHLLDKLVTRGGGATALAVLIWMNSTLSDMNGQINGLNTSLIQVTTEMKFRPSITKDDVRAIVGEDAPWVRERKMWEAWKSEQTVRTMDMKTRIRELETEALRHRGGSKLKASGT